MLMVLLAKNARYCASASWTIYSELVSEINLKVREAPTDIGVRRGEQRYENIEQDQDRYSGPADHH